MTVYTLSSTLPEGSFVDWTQTSLWAQGSAPSDPSAQVFFNQANSNFLVEIGQGETISIGSFQLQANHLLLDGALVSAGSVTVSPGAGIQISGGTLAAQSLHLNGTPGIDLGLVGVGTVTVAGPIYNDSTIIGGSTGLSALTALTLNTAYIDNLGLIDASVGTTLTVNVALPSGLANFAYGTLTAGTYEADAGGTLDLKTNGVIINDAATLILDGAGTDIIAGYNTSSGQYVPIQSSLSEITAKGTLELDAASYTTGGMLTVAGMLTLVGDSLFAAGTLYITSGGEAYLSEAVPGFEQGLSATHIINDGKIFADALGGGVAAISGAVTGSGTITLGPAVTTIDRFGHPTTTIATVDLRDAVSNGLAYTDGTGVFILDSPNAVTGAFQNFTAGDSIVLPGIAGSSVTSFSYAGSGSSGVLTVNEGGTTLHFNFTGSYTTADFALSTDGASGGTAITGTSLIGVAQATAAHTSAHG